MTPANRFPAIEDLRRHARRRIPRFAWEYLDSGTGADRAMARNRNDLDDVLLEGPVLAGALAPELSVSLFGHSYALPFGMAPVGASGMIWPGAEQALSRLAAARNIPYTLSTVATRTPEEIGPLAGDNGWFQMYTPGRDEVFRDLIRRARDSGFKVLVLTADVPVSSRRERQRRAGLTVPPSMTPRMMAEIALRPAWALGTARNGTPRFRIMEGYLGADRLADVTRRLAADLHSQPDWSILDRIRRDWDGPLILKGVMRPEDAARALDSGVDAIWVSNHGGRQLDAIPSAITALPRIRARVGDAAPLLFDSGLRSGLDIARALALGADFCMLGRPFFYGLGALGPTGAGHVVDILTDDLVNVMGQLGVNSLDMLAERLIAPVP